MFFILIIQTKIALTGEKENTKNTIIIAKLQQILTQILEML